MSVLFECFAKMSGFLTKMARWNPDGMLFFFSKKARLHRIFNNKSGKRIAIHF